VRRYLQLDKTYSNQIQMNLRFPTTVICILGNEGYVVLDDASIIGEEFTEPSINFITQLVDVKLQLMQWMLWAGLYINKIKLLWADIHMVPL
jgi:hypothetical protein